MSSADLYHQSGMGTDVPGRPNILERHSQHIEILRLKEEYPQEKLN
jgi:hypothetical protein